MRNILFFLLLITYCFANNFDNDKCDTNVPNDVINLGFETKKFLNNIDTFFKKLNYISLELDSKNTDVSYSYITKPIGYTQYLTICVYKGKDYDVANFIRMGYYFYVCCDGGWSTCDTYLWDDCC